MFFKILFIILFYLVFNQTTFGQSGSGKQIADSTKVYRQIETYSKRSGFTKLIYGILYYIINI